MAQRLHHECTRVPITALVECAQLYTVAAEGPYLRFYHRVDDRLISSRRVFEAQALHGIRVLSSTAGHVHLIVWGGVLIRTLVFSVSDDKDEGLSLVDAIFSKVARAPDWILDLQPVPAPPGDAHVPRRCVAVTAHNALLDIAQDLGDQHLAVKSPSITSVSELTSSSRSILYSAHLLWESADRILIAAGTAFGEIIYWSWDQSRPEETRSRIHHVFLGHEGSIFGVRISDMLCIDGQSSRRLLASCSDDRTIRIWDVSQATVEEGVVSLEGDNELQRTRHTGFSNSSFDTDVSNKDSVAIGWGHTSRVWKVEFLDRVSSSDDIYLVSAGEDATSRTWRLSKHIDGKSTSLDLLPRQLNLVDTAAHHNGKNVWAMSIPSAGSLSASTTLGGADSKITKFPLQTGSHFTEQAQYDIDFFASVAASHEETAEIAKASDHRSSKQTEFLRSYAFLDESSFILTTNSGRLFHESLSNSDAKITESKYITRLEDLSGYSVCAGEHSLGLAFIGGAKGSLYAYFKFTSRLTKLHTVNGKIGDIFVRPGLGSTNIRRLVLLVTLVGQKVAQLLDIDIPMRIESQSNDEDMSETFGPTISRTTLLSIPDHLTGLVITSMLHVDTSGGAYALFGYRRGSIAAYRIIDGVGQPAEPGSAGLLGLIQSAHGKETVTAMDWVPDSTGSYSGHLVSAGRDGCVAVHLVNLTDMSYKLVHNIALPVGPNIEGLHISNGELHAHGFSHKEFVTYNTRTEETTMSVETGGAHRSWSYQPNSSLRRGGTLVWTRASSMHIHTHGQPSHEVIRSGGHGREIKAIAVSPVIENNGSKIQLIATGSEDTDIKIFTYSDQHFTCLRTLRKHTTGIQSLQWSSDGKYLFSSGGCEEFYVWKVSHIPSELGGIGVVCEASCPPESEHSDLRIMAFDVSQHSEESFVISMVFSNSTIKVYTYTSGQAASWHKLASGLYFTSCLTQCTILPVAEQSLPQGILTAGTDGHAVLWPFPAPSEPDLKPLKYHSPVTIHQSSSKTLVAHAFPGRTDKTLVVSGGDDGTISLLAVRNAGAKGVEWTGRPVTVVRTHASAVTACAVFPHREQLLLVTSGNDQWVRLWEVILADEECVDESRDWVEVRRVGRVKTSVADVSSMAVLAAGGGEDAKVLICGVGMEVIRIQ